MAQGIPRVVDDPEVRAARTAKGNAKRWKGADSAEYRAAASRMREASAVAHVQRIVDEAPPLTAEQKARLAALLLADDDSTSAAS